MATSVVARWTLVRRLFGLAAAVALGVGSVIFYATAPADPASRQGAQPSLATTTPAAPPSEPRAVPPWIVTPSPLTTTAGPGLTTPGIHLVAMPRADGSFEVAEQIVLHGPVSRLILEPPRIAAAGPAFASTRPRALSVQVSADGRPVPRASVAIDRHEEVTLATSVARFEVRYLLSGVSVRSVPSTAGRALAAITPLTAAMDGSLPTSVIVNGDSVLNLRCPRLPAGQQACALGSAPRLTVRPGIAAANAMVLIQLDLPAPS